MYWPRPVDVRIQVHRGAFVFGPVPSDADDKRSDVHPATCERCGTRSATSGGWQTRGLRYGGRGRRRIPSVLAVRIPQHTKQRLLRILETSYGYTRGDDLSGPRRLRARAWPNDGVPPALVTESALSPASRRRCLDPCSEVLEALVGEPAVELVARRNRIRPSFVGAPVLVFDLLDSYAKQPVASLDALSISYWTYVRSRSGLRRERPSRLCYEGVVDHLLDRRIASLASSHSDASKNQPLGDPA